MNAVIVPKSYVCFKSPFKTTQKVSNYLPIWTKNNLAIELKPNDWGIYENRAYVYKAMRKF